MFDQKKCIAAMVIFLNRVKLDPAQKLELYLATGEQIRVEIPIPESEEKDNVIRGEFRLRAVADR